MDSLNSSREIEIEAVKRWLTHMAERQLGKTITASIEVIIPKVSSPPCPHRQKVNLSDRSPVRPMVMTAAFTSYNMLGKFFPPPQNIAKR
jgi:hypothetical protein